MHYFRLRSFFVLTEITKKFQTQNYKLIRFYFYAAEVSNHNIRFGMKCLIYDGMPVMTIVL